MAYSDYGGYAYRNGKRVVERSDATISPAGDIYGSPGMWPGFAAMMEGGKEEYEKRQEWPNGHVVLGDGPIYVALYKQSSLRVYRVSEKLDEISLLKNPQPEMISEWTDDKGVLHKWINADHFKDTDEMCSLEVDGWLIEAYFRIEDNHYQYVKVTQPDGNIWHGWAGYGVGAGLEDAGYGFSTSCREDVMQDLFPGSITPTATLS